MRCQEVQNLMPELVRDELSLVVEGLLERHLDSCASCAAVFGREQRLLASLRALPVASAPSDFTARALRTARVQHEAAQGGLRHVRRMGRVFAIAASVLVVCGAGFLLGRGSNGELPEQQSVVQLPLGGAQMVALKIDAPHAFEHVQFTVTLPENVALQDQPELREFAWTGQLQVGVNVLSLPLVGILPAGGQLLATVKYGTTTKSLRIPLNVGGVAADISQG